jgi:hypothetical protein
MTTLTYIQAISIGYPDIQCYALGDGSNYASLVWESGPPLPTQSDLDSWMAANPQPVNTKITVLALRNRFTTAEKVAIELASLDNPAEPLQQRQLAASLRVMSADLNVATYVDLARPDTIAGIQALETYGIIGSGRASQILTAPIQDNEIPANI